MLLMRRRRSPDIIWHKKKGFFLTEKCCWTEILRCSVISIKVNTFTSHLRCHTKKCRTSPVFLSIVEWKWNVEQPGLKLSASFVSWPPAWHRHQLSHHDKLRPAGQQRLLPLRARSGTTVLDGAKPEVPQLIVPHHLAQRKANIPAVGWSPRWERSLDLREAAVHTHVGILSLSKSS